MAIMDEWDKWHEKGSNMKKQSDNLPATHMPLSDVPAAWQGLDVASGEEIVVVERSKSPDDICALDAFLLTEIELLDTKFGKRHKYYITTPDGEEWNFTLGASSQNGQIGKLLQARLDLYDKFRAHPKAYVFALETVSTALGNDGYRFTTPVQKALNDQARAGRSPNNDMSERVRPHVTSPVTDEDFLPEFSPPSPSVTQK